MSVDTAGLFQDMNEYVIEYYSPFGGKEESAICTMVYGYDEEHALQVFNEIVSYEPLIIKITKKSTKDN